MRTILTLWAVACLAIGCSNQPSATETPAPDTDASPAASETAGEAAETQSEPSTQPETTEPEQATAASEEASPLVIDVRTQAEWDEGHLTIATHIPLDQIAARIGEVAPDKDQKIYLHCRSGGRSGQAKTELEGLGYTSVENVGGLDDARAKFESSTN